MSENKYKNMWEDFAKVTSSRYLDYKFRPTYRVGLTNYLRENIIYKFLNPQKTDIVLDSGCASGRQLFQIADKIREGYGIDISEVFIKAANNYKEENKISNLFFSAIKSEQLNFENNYFDKIICAEVMEHVADKDVLLKELLRVLKPKGTLIITTPNLNGDGHLWGRLLRLLGIRKFEPLKDFSEEALNKHGDAHVREFTKRSMIEWIQKYNLKIIDIKSVSFFDGPRFYNFLLKVLLHIKITNRLIISLENLFTKSNLFFGKQLIVKIVKE